jgi:hypothetical protein
MTQVSSRHPILRWGAPGETCMCAVRAELRRRSRSAAVARWRTIALASVRLRIGRGIRGLDAALEPSRLPNDVIVLGMVTVSIRELSGPPHIQHEGEEMKGGRAMK